MFFFFFWRFWNFKTEFYCHFWFSIKKKFFFEMYCLQKKILMSIWQIQRKKIEKVLPPPLRENLSGYQFSPLLFFAIQIDNLISWVRRIWMPRLFSSMNNVMNSGDAKSESWFGKVLELLHAFLVFHILSAYDCSYSNLVFQRKPSFILNISQKWMCKIDQFCICKD